MLENGVYRVGCLVLALLGAAQGLSPGARAQGAAASPASSQTTVSTAAPAASPTQTEIAEKTHTDYANMLQQLRIEHLRSGASGSPTGPDPANYDDAKVAPYTLPDPLVSADGRPVRSAAVWWNERRPQLVHLLEATMYGRMPATTPGVTWTVLSTENGSTNGVAFTTRKLRGHVDNAADPAIGVDIQVDLSLPAHIAGRIPVMIAFDWPPEFWAEMARRTGHAMPALKGPSSREQVLAKGWGYALLVPTSVQADNGAGLTSGIIGLCNRGAFRTPDQWGALRAWGWGAGKLLDYFNTVPEIDVHRVGIFGHSRYGKAALVTMAFDRRFAIGYISSSGEVGAKLSRRNFGELLENVASEGEYHWMAGNFLRYAGPLTVNDLPVDAHDLVALAAPRPLFIGAGVTHGDGWVDAEGQFEAAVAAGPVYRLLGQPDLGTTVFPPQGTEVGNGPLTFRQHGEGHTPAPNWPFFLDFVQRELKPVPSAGRPPA